MKTVSRRELNRRIFNHMEKAFSHQRTEKTVGVIDTSFICGFARRRLAPDENSLDLIQSQVYAYEQLESHLHTSRLTFPKQVAIELSRYVPKLETLRKNGDASELFEYLRPKNYGAYPEFSASELKAYEQSDFQGHMDALIREVRHLVTMANLLPSEEDFPSMTRPYREELKYELESICQVPGVLKDHSTNAFPKGHTLHELHDRCIALTCICLAHGRPTVLYTADHDLLNIIKEFNHRQTTLAPREGIFSPSHPIRVVKDYSAGKHKKKSSSTF